MVKILINSSNSGSTKQYHIVHENNVDIQSYAALILLNDDLKSQEEDENSEVQIYLNKRYDFLSNKLIQFGVLTCEYCGKTHLGIGHRLKKDSDLDNKNKNLATIDHRVPKALKQIDPLDETNWSVACKRCNLRKGTKSVDDFIKMKF
jgi:hypothetical protein